MTFENCLWYNYRNQRLRRRNSRGNETGGSEHSAKKLGGAFQTSREMGTLDRNGTELTGFHSDTIKSQI